MSNRFPDMRVPKVLHSPVKTRIFGLKTIKFGPKLAFFLVILGRIIAFLVHFDDMPDQNTMGARCLVGFLISVYQNYCSLSKNKVLGPKTAKFGPKYTVLVI